MDACGGPVDGRHYCYTIMNNMQKQIMLDMDISPIKTQVKIITTISSSYIILYHFCYSTDLRKPLRRKILDSRHSLPGDETLMHCGIIVCGGVPVPGDCDTQSPGRPQIVIYSCHVGIVVREENYQLYGGRKTARIREIFKYFFLEKQV